MRLRRFLLRYYPPGITIEYEKRGQTRTKEFFIKYIQVIDIVFAVKRGAAAR